MNATTPWSAHTPTECGEYLVEYIGDWFPEGNINNVSHCIVSIVQDEDGNIKALRNGVIEDLSLSDFNNYKWAKIINAAK